MASPPPDPFGIPPLPERRRLDTGPPPGTPDRRRSTIMPDFHNGISFGQLLQAATVAGSTISAIFAAGQYVQRLHDDLASSRSTMINNRQAVVASDEQIAAAIQRLMAAQAAQSGVPVAPATPTERQSAKAKSP